MSASSSADSGVFSEGFSTIRLLVAIAGATLCATWFSGWLNGVIAQIDAQQRLAQRVDLAAILPCGVRSQENTWPSSASACVAGEDEHVAGAAHFVASNPSCRVPHSARDQVGDRVAALADQFGACGSRIR